MSRGARSPSANWTKLGLFLDVVVAGAALTYLFGPGGPLREPLDAWRARRDSVERVRSAWDDLVATGGRFGPVPDRSRPGAGVLIELTDYRCPFCARAQAAVDSLLAARPGVTVIVRQLPIRSLHPDAPLLAGVAVCAEGTPDFPRVHRALFGAPADIETHLREAGVDEPRALLQCASSVRARERVEADLRLARRLGARGTPTFVTRDRLATGALSVAELHRMLGSDEPAADHPGRPTLAPSGGGAVRASERGGDLQPLARSGSRPGG